MKKSLPLLLAMAVSLTASGCLPANKDARAKQVLEELAKYGPATSEDEGEPVGFFLPEPDAAWLEWLRASECPKPKVSKDGCYQYLTVVQHPVTDTRLCRCKSSEYWPCSEKKCGSKLRNADYIN